MTVTNPVPSLLLVDDDAVFRRLMSALFQQDGFQVTAFESAETAFDALELRTFKVAIVDYKLPDLNGIDFFERTRRSHPDMVRILITAHTTEEVLLDAINRGEVYRYLNKPVHTGLLRSTVEQALVLNELTTSRNMILASLDERNRELEQKNSDLARFNHLLGELRVQQVHLLASLPDPFLLLKEDGRVVRSNDAAGRLFGRSRGALLNADVATLLTDPGPLEKGIAISTHSSVHRFSAVLRSHHDKTAAATITAFRLRGDSGDEDQIALVFQVEDSDQASSGDKSASGKPSDALERAWEALRRDIDLTLGSGLISPDLEASLRETSTALDGELHRSA